MDRDRLTALLEAYLVTFLWSSSYVLVKVGLTEVSPLTLVTLRYIVASIVLLPIAIVRGETAALREKGNLMKLLFLGLTGYTVAQGLQCVGLFYLPAVSVTFILNFTPVIVLAMGVVALGERPTRLQLAGMLLVLVGGLPLLQRPPLIQPTPWGTDHLGLRPGLGLLPGLREAPLREGGDEASGAHFFLNGAGHPCLGRCFNLL